MSWRDNLIKIEPYVAGEQPNKTDFIKLNANENPYPPAPGVLRAIEQFRGGSLKKYPDANAKPLADALAKRFGLQRENVFVGNGSDDVLALCFRAFFNSDKPVIYPDITYSFYPVWCEMLHIPFETIPVDDSFNINAADYKRPNGGVVIANPNAPTSIGRGLDFMREILDANPDSVVISDEAYVDFGGTSSVPLLKEYENLVVVQTFSKSRSMAGMRIGYALGNKEIISALFAAIPTRWTALPSRQALPPWRTRSISRQRCRRSLQRAGGSLRSSAQWASMLQTAARTSCLQSTRNTAQRISRSISRPGIFTCATSPKSA